MMRLEKYIVPTIFPDHLPDATRMISHETMKNVLRPKNHHGFEHARAEDDRQPIDILLVGIPHRPDHTIRMSWKRRLKASRKSPNSENYKKYKVFKITTKIVEHRDYAD